MRMLAYQTITVDLQAVMHIAKDMQQWAWDIHGTGTCIMYQQLPEFSTVSIAARATCRIIWDMHAIARKQNMWQ